MDDLGIVRDVARIACEQAVLASPPRGRRGEARVCLGVLLPVARALCDGDGGGFDAGALAYALGEVPVAVWADPATRWVDGCGHSRPAYRLLAGWMLGRARDMAPGDEGIGRVAHAYVEAQAKAPAYPDDEPHHALWSLLIRGADGAGANGFVSRIDELVGDGQSHASLVSLGVDDQLEPWTMRELVGLHALDRLARSTGRKAWRRRVAEIAGYHHGHTQPDYTTYQPWALAAFMSDAATASFAHQQLHDVQTHLAVSGPSGAVVVALLLCEACDALRSGRGAEQGVSR